MQGHRRRPLSIAIVDSHRRPLSKATANHRRTVESGESRRIFEDKKD
ncbi:uncharacterized protein G2W53_040745 [Senna tora]|uniref:Uncharacterized protein n=1 Tax=Senna tora TaxID=362788 RepID=A0A834W299_9FABA|nr:uncharacterized protein G2W53_040745 [Senna tora]